jgi:hypothetical protein
MAREVNGVTREVARLQRERQTIEHQLSELFDLLSKQRRLVLVSDSVAARHCSKGLSLNLISKQEPMRSIKQALIATDIPGLGILMSLNTSVSQYH